MKYTQKEQWKFTEHIGTLDRKI